MIRIPAVAAGSGGGGGISSISVIDHGTATYSVTGINFSGAGVTIASAGTTATATISSGGSSTWDTISAAAGDATTANSTHVIVYNTAPTADSKVAWTFGETSAATNGSSTNGTPNQVLLYLKTLANSTQSAFRVDVRGNFVMAASPTSSQMIFKANSGGTPVLSTGLDLTSGFGFENSGSWPSMSAGGNNILIAAGSSPSGIWIVPAGTNAKPTVTDFAQSTTGLNWFAGANTMSVVDATAHEIVRFIGGASPGLRMVNASLFTANGSTLWAVGNNCPGNATVQKWLTVQDSAGTSFYIPCF